MYIFLNFFLLLIVVIKFNPLKNFKEIILITILFFSSFIVISTELLGFFNSLNLFYIINSWIIFSVCLISSLFYKKKETYLTFYKKKTSLFTFYKSLLVYEKAFFFAIIILVLLLFYQGFIYPPNNWDSLTYHMSRIMYWIGNENLEHFPTHILRHLYQPPFAEYIILHINLLEGNDYFSNSVQLIFLLFTLISIYALLDVFEIKRIYKLIAVIFAITVPSVMLQSTTTKNDIVCSFFVITTLYFAIKSYRFFTLKNYSFLGLTIGLAMLTKGTSYIFIGPILLLFIVFLFLKIKKTKEFQPFILGIYSILLIIFINIGHFSRNFEINKNILTIDETESKMYFNDSMSPKLFLSSFLKNIGLHMGYFVNETYNQWVEDIHYDQEIFIDSPEINYFGLPYKGADEFVTHEDLVPNTAHILLIFLSSAVLLIFGSINFRKNKEAILLLLLVFLQFFLFIGYLKWQPWHTRLHIPLFLLSSCLVAIAIKAFNPFKWVIFLSVPVMLMNYYYYFTFNSLRPILKKDRITKEISIYDERYKKYFPNQIQLYPEYLEIKTTINSSNFKKIGFMLTDWEYPLLIDFYRKKLQLRAINVKNITAKISQNTDNMDAIISNTVNQEFIIFEGKKFKNLTPKHLFIWIYK